MSFDIEAAAFGKQYVTMRDNIENILIKYYYEIKAK
jgi:hypothetical protein